MTAGGSKIGVKHPGMKSWWSNQNNREEMRRARKKYPDEYSREYTLFVYMIKRGKNIFVFWPRTPKGFAAFIKCVGAIPKGMKRPSLGRKNHKKGYQPGNCGWQEYYDNILEAATRPSNNKIRSMSMKSRWQSQKFRSQMVQKGKIESMQRRRGKNGSFLSGGVS